MDNNIQRIREALQFIDPSDRQTWVRMGMAIKSELADTGFDVWETWSQQAESFSSTDASDVWKSLRAGGKVTVGTLFHEAKANGWRDDGGHQIPTPEELAERRRVAVDRENREKLAIERERADTAKKAAAILKAASQAKADNPYLVRKRVSPVATLREIDAGAAAAILGYPPKSGGDLLTGRLLVVPVKQGDGISTLELIDGDKRKAALAGRGSKVGGYWATERLAIRGIASLDLFVRPGTTAEQREAVLLRWHREQLKVLIPPLLEKWQPILGVHVADWGIKKMKTKWGSCNPASRRVWFNLELAKKPVQCLEYIVVHELVHLLERHHNERFAALLETHLPQWRQYREMLSKAPLGHEEWEY